MAGKKQYVSTSLERQIIAYLKPRKFEMFIADMFLHYRGKSEHAAFIIDKHYDAMTEYQRSELLKAYETIKDKYEPKRGAHKRI